MPDIRLADGLIATSSALQQAGGRRPKQADLRRAVSGAYYAVFHELARTCADVLVGATKRNRPNKAWVEVYRGLEHGAVKDACRRANKIDFPQEIKDFAEAFGQLQSVRHQADYDPMIRFTKLCALACITLSQDSIDALKGAPKSDRVAFATWVLIPS